MNTDDGRAVESLRDGRQLVGGIATHVITHGEIQLNEQLPLLLRLRSRNLLGGQDPGLGRELDHAMALREDGGEEEVGGRQRRVPAERDLKTTAHMDQLRETTRIQLVPVRWEARRRPP